MSHFPIRFSPLPCHHLAISYWKQWSPKQECHFLLSQSLHFKTKKLSASQIWYLFNGMKLSASTNIKSFFILCLLSIEHISKKLTLELNIKSGLLRIIGESERAIDKSKESNVYKHQRDQWQKENKFSKKKNDKIFFYCIWNVIGFNKKLLV